ncbi:hypothetical protein GRI43_13645 [Altererythrobacter luteolus]|uniref:Uncharacterized protein n=1 Tax=Pontixanthobacter luteolus TaxID=295089 RepID=A0A6I4V9C8_9SPHN|nr:hypothetical protein [Pontixanthobacter luteolus]MXP48432.1 hypothetical protein [Pontixanthobacter luteolus]
MMTGRDEAVSERAIEMVRNLQRRLANECHAKGISPEDIALASLYSAFDIAEGAKGPGLAAVEWLRTGLDVIERQVMEKVSG